MAKKKKKRDNADKSGKLRERTEILSEQSRRSMRNIQERIRSDPNIERIPVEKHFRVKGRVYPNRYRHQKHLLDIESFCRSALRDGFSPKTRNEVAKAVRLLKTCFEIR